MTYGPPPEPNAHPGPTQPHPQQSRPNHPQQPGTGYLQQPGPNNPQQPGQNYPQHLWPDYSQQPGPSPSGSPAVEPAKGSGLLAVAALILGLAGLVAPFLPMAMDGFRQYAAFPFALPGLGLAIAGLIGRRRAKPLAAIAAMLSVLALAVGAYMVVAYTFNL
jgi:hypothetical protein